MLLSLGAFYIHPERTDARISVPIGSLLAVVFLQQSYDSALPDVGYMVLMDKIYLLAYALELLIMLRVIMVGNGLSRSKKQPDYTAIRRNDIRYFWLYISLMMAGTALLIFIS